MCVAYHHDKIANPSGAVTVMISVRQSVIRKAIPASIMLPTAQDRLPITLKNARWGVLPHSMTARIRIWERKRKKEGCKHIVSLSFRTICSLVELRIGGVNYVQNTWLLRVMLWAYWELLRWYWFLSVQSHWEISALQTQCRIWQTRWQNQTQVPWYMRPEECFSFQTWK